MLMGVGFDLKDTEGSLPLISTHAGLEQDYKPKKICMKQ